MSRQILSAEQIGKVWACLACGQVVGRIHFTSCPLHPRERVKQVDCHKLVPIERDRP